MHSLRFVVFAACYILLEFVIIIPRENVVYDAIFTIINSVADIITNAQPNGMLRTQHFSDDHKTRTLTCSLSVDRSEYPIVVTMFVAEQ